MLHTSQLQFQYPGSNYPIKFPELICPAGSSLLIKGPSGSGKTTWLHMIAGLLKPKDGKIIIHNQDIVCLNAQMMDKFRATHIGLVLQRAHFISSLNVMDNLLLFQKLSNKREDKVYVRRVLASLDLTDMEKRRIHSLSQGEAQRLGLARAVINKPHLLLADEPTSSLDDVRADAAVKLLMEQSKSIRSSLIVVSHDARISTYFDQQIHLS